MSASLTVLRSTNSSTPDSLSPTISHHAKHSPTAKDFRVRSRSPPTSPARAAVSPVPPSLGGLGGGRSGMPYELRVEAGKPSLMISLIEHDWTLSLRLIDTGTGIFHMDEEGRTVLYVACRERAPLAVLDALLTRGLNSPNTPKDNGATPLYIACQNYADDPGVIRRLLQSSGNPNVALRGVGATPLMVALQARAPPETLRALLAHGGDPNRARRNGATALHSAVVNNADEESIALLVQHGGDLSRRVAETGATPLYLACATPQRERAVRALLRRGADPCAEAKDGSTALHALMRPDVEPSLVEDLILIGRAPVDPRNRAGETPLMRAVSRAPRLVPALLKHGADPHRWSENGGSAIDRCVSSVINVKCAEELESLLECVAALKALERAASAAPGSPLADFLARDGDHSLKVRIRRMLARDEAFLPSTYHDMGAGPMPLLE